MTYRRRTDSDAWHFCKNCSNWPTSGYKQETAKPTSGELCDECKAKKKRGDCE
jgi:hypothetical protein